MRSNSSGLPAPTPIHSACEKLKVRKDNFGVSLTRRRFAQEKTGNPKLLVTPVARHCPHPNPELCQCDLRYRFGVPKRPSKIVQLRGIFKLPFLSDGLSEESKENLYRAVNKL
jgi:hypothetical protein